MGAKSESKKGRVTRDRVYERPPKAIRDIEFANIRSALETGMSNRSELSSSTPVAHGDKKLDGEHNGAPTPCIY